MSADVKRKRTKFVRIIKSIPVFEVVRKRFLEKNPQKKGETAETVPLIERFGIIPVQPDSP
jgi:hypothetical protein